MARKEAGDREEGKGALMRLIPTPLAPTDLRAGLEDLMQGVDSGHVIGLGLVVMVRGGDFFVDSLGLIRRRPHDARGWTHSLMDHFKELGEIRNHAATTR
jgi:hypothetical protein